LLQEQPLQVLRILVENEGALVSREEIRRTPWPNDTIVEFEHSINAAITKLRKALGDQVAEPDTFRRWRAGAIAHVEDLAGQQLESLYTFPPRASPPSIDKKPGWSLVASCDCKKKRAKTGQGILFLLQGMSLLAECLRL
jgi:hypothetical protein